MVEDRKRDTLIPLIKAHVKKGSTIHSDQWAAYYRLNEGYTHETVNHTEEFVTEAGVATNEIEGLWGNVKLRIKKMKGVGVDTLDFILNEFMYRYRYGQPNGDVYFPFLNDLRRLYNFENK